MVDNSQLELSSIAFLLSLPDPFKGRREAPVTVAIVKSPNFRGGDIYHTIVEFAFV